MIQGFEIDLETGENGTIVDLWPGTGGHVSSVGFIQTSLWD